jgi:hypothetical protein
MVMARYAIVVGGVVTNVVEAEDTPENGVATDAAGPGWTYSGGTFTAPDLPEQFAVLTRYQFVRGLRINTCHVQIRAGFTGLGSTEAQQDRWDNEVFWRREDAMLEEIRASTVVTSAKMDQVFRDGAAA